MRMYSALLPAVGVWLMACDDTSGPSTSSTGTLVVSTSTGGNAPDPDGYRLAVDGADSLDLEPTGTTQIDLPAGHHDLELLGVAEHCSIVSAPTLQVEVPLHSTTTVAFEISCGLTGARITTTTTRPDLDPDGYRILVDGTDRGAIAANNTMLIALDPGSRTIALTGLAPDCAVTGPPSRTVTVVASQVVPIEFGVVCTATTPASPTLAFRRAGDIYLAGMDGSNLRQLTFDGPPNANNSEPAWSPDGSRIAFTKYDSQGGAGIYVVAADGTNLTRLSPEGAYDESPTWSPDGSQIAFETRRDSTGYNGVNSWLDPEIYVMNADGTRPVRLTKHLGHNDYTPAWSPDGSRIAYVSDTADGTHIYVVNVDGTSPIQVTSGKHDDYAPDWSPDGSRIVFSRGRDLFLVNADGTNLTLLLSGGTELGGLADPAWSPHSHTIAFTRISNCTQDPYGDYHCRVGIWVIGLAGGTTHQLPLPNGSGGPSWRP